MICLLKRADEALRAAMHQNGDGGCYSHNGQRPEPVHAEVEPSTV
jgi:hypothetical protein